MKRVFAALTALLFHVPAFALAAPHMRHAAAAKPAACRTGSVRLASGLCCPRSGVTRRGGCVSGAIRPDAVPPGSSRPLTRRESSRTPPYVVEPQIGGSVAPSLGVPDGPSPLARERIAIPRIHSGPRPAQSQIAPVTPQIYIPPAAPIQPQIGGPAPLL